LYLQRLTLDLFEAWKSIYLALKNQLTELKTNQAKQHIRIPLDLDKSLYRAIIGWISHEALRKVEEQQKLCTQNPPPSPICTGTFTRVYGLPCLHALNMRSEELLLLEDFHSHWRLIHNGAPIHLFESRQQRNQQKLPESSNRREPSQFEVIEAAARTAPTCSKCHLVGHRRGARVCLQRYVAD
jgi:hypothetical protein